MILRHPRSSAEEIVMKIAVSATGPGLDTQVDPRFGRCAYFVIIDPDSMQFENIENSNATASGGAGIATAQMIAGQGVEAILTGHCGPNAFEVLKGAGIEVITGVSGTVPDVVRDYKAGKYEASTGPDARPHSGMGRGRGTA